MNDPADPGGETNFGISKRAHPAVNIAELTRETAEQIYLADYWYGTGQAIGLGRGTAVSPVGAALLDFAVHSGVTRAVTELQALVGTKADGVIGRLTRAAVERQAYELLARHLVERRRAFLAGLVDRDSSLGKFSAGWGRRLDALLDALTAREF